MSANVQAVAATGAPRLSDMSLFRQQAYVDGAWIDADSGETIEVTNPATGEVLGTVPKLGAAETPEFAGPMTRFNHQQRSTEALIAMCRRD